MELTPCKPERLVRRQWGAAVLGPDAVTFQMQSDAGQRHRCSILQCPSDRLDGEGNRSAVGQDHAENGFLDWEAKVPITDREDGSLIVAASKRVTGVGSVDPAILGEDGCLGR